MVIAGCGQVGVLNALGLARAGIDVVLLERAPAVVQSPRAMVYHWSVLEGLERLGILDAALTAGFTKQEYDYLVFATGEKISYRLDVLDELTTRSYNLHLSQDVLVEIALGILQSYDNAEVRFDTTIVGLGQDANGVRVHVESAVGSDEVAGGWLVGADGAVSAVRRLLGFEFAGITWEHRFVVTNIHFDFEKYDYARSTLIIDPTHGAIVSKIDRHDLWRCTYAEEASLDEAGVLDRMPDYFRAVLPGDGEYEIELFSPHRMHQRVAESMLSGRVLLAGDAAHATNPTGGFGLTSGLFDTFVLYEALACSHPGEADERVLDRYAEERKRVFVGRSLHRRRRRTSVSSITPTTPNDWNAILWPRVRGRRAASSCSRRCP